MPLISIVIPCYFNEENIPVTFNELIQNEKFFDDDIAFEYILVDDGSQDGTYLELEKIYNSYANKVKIIKLSRNFGSYNAFLAGLNHATGDCHVLLTADLQDPPDLIPKMLNYWKQGFKIVIANREDREEPIIQKIISGIYHKLIKKYGINKIPSGGFDLVLFDRVLRDHLVQINEKNTNQVYLLTWLGFDYVNIPYVRKKREIGKSKWTTSKKIKLFIDSFVSFSYLPLRTITIIGILLGLTGLGYAFFILINKIIGNVPVQGWATNMIVLLIVSSFILL